MRQETIAWCAGLPFHDLLKGVRLGSVSYLNARPLVEGLPQEQVVYEVPAKLTERFLAGELDAALVPVFPLLQQREAWMVDGVGIGCRGAVYSVLMAYQGAFSAIREVLVDPASRSSTNLLQCLAHTYWKQPMRYVAEATARTTARLIIGDPAIAFRQAQERRQADGGGLAFPAADSQNADPENTLAEGLQGQAGTGGRDAGVTIAVGDEPWQICDLGEAWFEATGLPFVFAGWAIRPGHPEPERLAEGLRAAARFGLLQREVIAKRTEDPGFALHYLMEFIRYDLQADEKRGLERFWEGLVESELLGSTQKPVLHFV